LRSITQIIVNNSGIFISTDLPDLSSVLKGKLPSFSDLNRTSLSGEKRKNYSPVPFLLALLQITMMEKSRQTPPGRWMRQFSVRDTVVK
jgi:hypothetical protein